MKNIILVGNSNVGKTTLFNTLTGSDEHVGNFAGVTTQIKSKSAKEFVVYDLPGIYSLDCFSMEEQVSKDFLLSHKNDYILNVVECKNLSRNLFLTLQMIELGLKPILVVNMVDEVEKTGGSFNAKILSAKLGVFVFVVDARDKNSCNKLLKNLCKKQPNSLPYGKNSQNLSQKRYEYIDSFVNYVLKVGAKENKLQKLLFNKWFFLLSFICVFCFVFWFCFAQNGVGGIVSSYIGTWVEKVKVFADAKLSVHCPMWLISFVVQVVIEGVGTVAKFLPQIVLLFFFLGLLQDTGYISHVAFAFDGLMSKIGLDGKSIFTFLLCFGCNTSAVATSNNLQNKESQKRTLLLSPFVPCSAKMPVFFTILALATPVFKGWHVLVIIALYIVSIVVMFFVAKLLHNIKDDEQNFVLEISSLRMPSLKRVLKTLYKNSKEFVARLVGMLFLCMAIVWLSKSFSWQFEFLQSGDIESSILASVGKGVSFVFKPIGLDNWKICISLLLGITAKEVVAGSLVLLFGSSFGVLSWQQVVVFLLFVCLYMPCVSTVAIVKKECGAKVAFISVLLNTTVAYAVCFVFYSFSLAFAKSVVFGLVLCICVVFVALSIGFVLKYKCKKCKRCKLENFSV